MSSPRQAAVDFVSRYHHAERELELLVGTMARSGPTVLVFFARRGDEAIPIEVRFTGSGHPTASEALGLLANYPPVPNNPTRLTSQMLRWFSFGEAVAATQAFHRDSAADLELVRLPNPEWVMRSEDHLFGYRNTRDLIAAVHRLNAAAIYVKAVQSGDSQPAKAVMEEMGLESLTRARNLIAGARREGFLTGGMPGVIGGTFTEHAGHFLRVFRALQQSLEVQDAENKRRRN